ncbi:MAG: response regulator [Deltaproteobacteria bacterium]|jgi:putative two-component system response regulator|nr:response regulator [Deltaproteobacteria bacterium]
MKKEILVVDDNLATLKQTAAYLKERYAFSLMRSGQQAIAYCEAENPDLVLLDVDMPDMDGFETIKHLKSLANMKHVPVIFISAYIDSGTEVKALESGARDFIGKPVDSSILLHRIALHLELSEYEYDLEKTRKELENNIVFSFADLVESKDSHTGGHVLRTRRYLEIIGYAAISKGLFPDELDQERLELMVKATPFHDIGKIGISDVILLKPGPLNDQEYEEMKRHTIVGSNFIRNIYRRLPEQQYLYYAMLMAEGHHERWDGKGYPHGLKGEEIPFCSRLLSVANVYDACLTARIYRPAMTHIQANEVILNGRGTEYDPRIVDVYVAVKDIFAAFNVNQTSLPQARRRVFTFPSKKLG